ncbi:hypothetical protein BCON_1570g00010 [Botryotinia convoluta]|uniref:Uncharacterized protein n=1 Tax=Botryotinia convoluta TaxID=54673 RepID=A0A4Z1H812_9HELO|nr:hypothetical protein BCON_1570g00010 [Botryotinia convoluta]
MGMGSTFQVRLFGQMGFFTTDPENLKAMLATRFGSEEFFFFLSLFFSLGSICKISPSIPTPNPTLHPTDFRLGSRRSGLYPMIGEGIFT